MTSKRASPKSQVSTSIIYPLVQKWGSEFHLSDANIAELERVGDVSLSADLIRRLNNIGWNWTAQLTTLRSPRPKQFRKRLELIEDTLAEAYKALDLNRAGASIWEHHLFTWAGNAKVQGGASFFEDADELLIRMTRMTELVSALKPALPVDRGRWRPYDDERHLIALADVFKHAGGDPVIYTTEHRSDGMANTPFRRFAQEFYKTLPVQSKRKPKGFDEALRQAMRSRKLARLK